MNSRSSKQVQSTTIKQMDPTQLNAIQIIIYWPRVRSSFLTIPVIKIKEHRYFAKQRDLLCRRERFLHAKADNDIMLDSNDNSEYKLLFSGKEGFDMNSRSSKQVQSTTIKQMDPKQLNAIQIIIYWPRVRSSFLTIPIIKIKGW